MKKILLGALASLLILSACASKGAQDGVRTVFIGPQKVHCVGVAPMQCMQVKNKVNAPWQLFYDQIEGFNFEAGYDYILEVKVEKRADVPADASSEKWTLVKVVSKAPSVK